ncbi:hypothetical protein AcW1_008415 [Taiwanofungus camphoratus]|nr:hypothetical protein AcV5_008707 [Antrodia cinnamomea]KAI0951355.1 hypothetical protein AcW1_008415 [Antrodia cinnamomea]
MAATEPSPSIFATFTSDSMAVLLDYIGTTVFLLLAFGGIQASQGEAGSSPSTSSNIERIMYISLSMGFSLLVSAWLFFSGLRAASPTPSRVKLVLYSTFLGQGVNPAQGVFIEMFITATLIISVLMLAVEKHMTTPFAPVSVFGSVGFIARLF